MNFSEIEKREFNFNKQINKINQIVRKSEELKDDVVWLKKIIDWLFLFYNQLPNINVFKSEKEDNITFAICNYLKKNKKFGRALLVVNLQVQNDSKDNIGYYDLKFETPIWQKGRYLTVECKRLNKNSNSIKEYVCNGMYRFVTEDKYSPNLSFGAMLGYIQDGETDTIISKIKSKICKTETINLLDNEQVYTSNVLNYPHTFQSQHHRNNQIDIELMHLFFEFQ